MFQESEIGVGCGQYHSAVARGSTQRFQLLCTEPRATALWY